MRRTDAFGDIESELATLAASGKASLAVAVRSSDGEWTRYGSPDPARESRFEIGSVSKALTGSLLGVLAASGEVDPNAPVDEFLDDRLPWAGSAPTLIDLATHRSGLPNTPRPLFLREMATALGFSTRDPWRGVTASTYREYLHVSARRARRRGRFGYSSMGVGLLGDALAAAAKLPFEELVQTRLLNPLGMHRTGLDRPSTGPDVVEPPINRRGVTLPYLQDAMPAAGMYASTITDLQRLADALIDSGPAEVAEGLRMSTTVHHHLDDKTQLGLCWFLTGAGAAREVAHSGGTWGSQAQFSVRPATGKAVVALTSTHRPIDTFTARYLAAPTR